MNLEDLIAAAAVDITLFGNTTDIRVGGVRLVEFEDSGSFPARALLLVLGKQDETSLENIAAIASKNRCAAILIKSHDLSRNFLEKTSRAHKVSIGVVSHESDWLTLSSRLRSAISSGLVDRSSSLHIGDLFGLANAIAVAAGGATSIVDPSGRLLGFSTLLEHQTDELRRRATVLMQEIDDPVDDPEYQEVLATENVVFFPSEGDRFARAAIAIRCDGEVLGIIWALITEKNERVRAERTLLQFKDSATIHLLHARSDLSIQQNRRALLLEELIKGGTEAQSAARSLGLPEGLEYRLIVFFKAEKSSELSLHRFQSIANRFRSNFETIAIAKLDSELVFLIAEEQEEESISSKLEGILKVSDNYPDMVGLVSTPITKTEDVTNQYQSLMMLKRLVAQKILPFQQVILLSKSWTTVDFARSSKKIESTMLDQIINLIRSEPRGNDTWQTLRTFITSDRNISTTAKKMHVHENTVRYRLERLSKHYSLDLSNPFTHALLLGKMMSEQ